MNLLCGISPKWLHIHLQGAIFLCLELELGGNRILDVISPKSFASKCARILLSMNLRGDSLSTWPKVFFIYFKVAFL